MQGDNIDKSSDFNATDNLLSGKQLGSSCHLLTTKNGEGGIRTRGRGLYPYDGLANRCLQPLGHLSILCPFDLNRYSIFRCP